MEIHHFKENSHILILSVLDRILERQNDHRFIFHFRGYLRGEQVLAIHLSASPAHLLKKGEAYLILMDQVELKSGILKGRILNFEQVFP